MLRIDSSATTSCDLRLANLDDAVALGCGNLVVAVYLCLDNSLASFSGRRDRMVGCIRYLFEKANRTLVPSATARDRPGDRDLGFASG